MSTKAVPSDPIDHPELEARIRAGARPFASRSTRYTVAFTVAWSAAAIVVVLRVLGRLQAPPLVRVLAAGAVVLVAAGQIARRVFLVHAVFARPLDPGQNVAVDLERRGWQAGRRLAWADVVAGTAGTLAYAALMLGGAVYGVRRFGMPDHADVAVPIFAILVLLPVGGQILKIYGTWARYAIPLEEKRNVALKPMELGGVVLGLLVVVLFAVPLLRSGSAGLVALGGTLLLVLPPLLIRSYRRTAAGPIVNPIDVAPITVDPAERVQVSVAGIMRAGRPFGREGFGQIASFWTPQSGRRLDPTAQNALLASRRRLYFIFVPVGFGDQAMMQYRELELPFSGSRLRTTLEKMLRTMSLAEIYRSQPINFAIELTEIARFEVRKTDPAEHRLIRSPDRIDFFDRQGRPLAISVFHREDLDRLETFLHAALDPTGSGTISGAGGRR